MKAKVEKLLIKRGWNADDAARIIEINLDTAMKCYPASKASFLADVVVM